MGLLMVTHIPVGFQMPPLKLCLNSNIRLSLWPWWWLEHLVATSASYFPNSSWYQITFSSLVWQSPASFPGLSRPFGLETEEWWNAMEGNNSGGLRTRLGNLHVPLYACALKHQVRTNSKWVYECTLSLFIVTLRDNEGTWYLVYL